MVPALVHPAFAMATKLQLTLLYSNQTILVEEEIGHGDS